MSRVDVCFDDETIYNLKDMSILSKLPRASCESLYDHLSAIAQEYTIEIAMMGFNHPLRNAVYIIFPKATVIINPLDVEKMISHYLGKEQIISSALEEVAAGIEDQPLENCQVGCQFMYDQKTKKEAMHYYRQWQGDVPLGIKSFYHVIKTIDYYYEEIFNYFEFKDILSMKHHKIRQS